MGIIGSGDQAVSMSAIDMCGRATVAVLRTPQNFANRAAYFADFTVSNNELLDMVRRINPRGSWKGEQFKLSYMLEMAEELWNKDTETGVEDRVNAPACEMWRLYALFVETEGNDYGADFQDKVEPGFGVTKEVFEFELRRAIGY